MGPDVMGPDGIDSGMRRRLTFEGLRELMLEIARHAPSDDPFRVFILGGATAVMAGWRESTIDADLYADDDAIFRDIQEVKELLEINVEFARPEHFVPALEGSASRHVFIDILGNVSFFHYDPYAQLLSKIVRGFDRDLFDGEHFLTSGMVDVDEFRALVEAIPEADYAKYPALSRDAVLGAVDQFLPG